MIAQAHLREARMADIPAIVALLREDLLGQTREALPDDPLYAQAFDRMHADPNNRLYVVEHADTVIGCAQLTIIHGLSRKGTSRAVIEAVRVGKSARGSGLGTFLMEELIRKAAEHGCSLVQLTSDKARNDAHRFYERLGFVRSHEGFKKVLP